MKASPDSHSSNHLNLLRKKLQQTFYLRPTLTVARDLLGKYLCRKVGQHLFVGKIVEVEAYLGALDPASHAFRGRTSRNEVMFREGGHLYVYFTYGMHYCANVVTEREGKGTAVLLRALEPAGELDAMKQNRFRIGRMSGKQTPPLEELCNGPAKLCQALGITRNENGTDLCGTRIWIAEPPPSEALFRIERSERIGISKGKEQRWRFHIRGSSFASGRKSGASTPHKRKKEADAHHLTS